MEERPPGREVVLGKADWAETRGLDWANMEERAGMEGGGGGAGIGGGGGGGEGRRGGGGKV